MLRRCIQEITLRKYKLIIDLSDDNRYLYITFQWDVLIATCYDYLQSEIS